MPVVVVHPGSPATTAGGIAVTKPLPAAQATTFRLLLEDENTMSTESGLPMRTEQG